ncbi:MAG TPA: hypothetical protein VFI42_13980 [Thermomicrobiaceae bacterium]|nr:hypothetical protein [Thermomicrobiaceae bacterium]
MTTTKPKQEDRIHELTKQEARELFDQVARKYLNMSGEEFLRRWDAGEFRDQDTPALIQVAILRHLAK